MVREIAIFDADQDVDAQTQEEQKVHELWELRIHACIGENWPACILNANRIIRPLL